MPHNYLETFPWENNFNILTLHSEIKVKQGAKYGFLEPDYIFFLLHFSNLTHYSEEFPANNSTFSVWAGYTETIFIIKLKSN